jgi:hypothetical protein
VYFCPNSSHPREKHDKMNRNSYQWFSPKTNMLLYGLLLLLTPFLLLQNYLQDAIGMLSEWSFGIGDVQIPFLLVGFALFVTGILVRFRNSITRNRLVVWLLILLMWIIGQQISDYYLDTSFFHLQHNWHYFAYGIFSFLAYQAFALKWKDPAKIILRIFLSALLISSFDESAQVFLSSRVFDTSDIAKDLWGVTMGIIFLFFIYNDPAPLFKKGWSLIESKVKGYFTNPLALVFMMFIFSFILLFVSSALSDPSYTFHVISISVVTFLFVFLLIQITTSKNGRRIVIVLMLILLLGLGLSVIRHIDKPITYRSSGINLIYGIPIPYFDVILFENGGFRIVDKKVHFNQTDQKLLFKKSSNILLIGSGRAMIQRMGFPEDLESQFVYNPVSKRGLQVIILPTEDACRVYNRLKKENKKVTFVVHNN